ncbi:hypothetical protein HSX37_12340|uniref:Uncharacterized protein n=1 Tax=Dendrosporobacter quercicolus TaxID=146817 RepID=A0A1G9TXB2_9FIRM|nr:hypothetical protein [Dendrosporobacter quercicolus]NSL48822.1 hypothetical protein [Dendrosporobacter quercicolus DSM 1736]SDM52238.1 hypothetical protein SAMN04488502_105118 [Dendrosporobacter quercicolus]
MLRFFTRILPGIIICLTLLAGQASAAAGESILLQKDTDLHPQGWSVGKFIKFKKDSVAVLNQTGEVISGTLDKNTFLQPRGWNRVINDYYYTTVRTDIGPFLHRYYHPFISREYNVTIPGYGHLLYKGGAAVTFSEQGDVLSGTLADKATIRLGDNKYGFVTFKSNTLLEFYPSGAVKTGVLEEDTYLRPVNWRLLTGEEHSAGYIKFSKGRQLSFNEDGEVLTGAIKDKATLPAKDGSQQIFPAGSTIDFAEVCIIPPKQAKTD